MEGWTWVWPSILPSLLVCPETLEGVAAKTFSSELSLKLFPYDSLSVSSNKSHQGSLVGGGCGQIRADTWAARPRCPRQAGAASIPGTFSQPASLPTTACTGASRPVDHRRRKRPVFPSCPRIRPARGSSGVGTRGRYSAAWGGLLNLAEKIYSTSSYMATSNKQ